MYLLFIGKQKNGHYLAKDFVIFWPMFTYVSVSLGIAIPVKDDHTGNFPAVWTTQCTESTSAAQCREWSGSRPSKEPESANIHGT